RWPGPEWQAWSELARTHHGHADTHEQHTGPAHLIDALPEKQCGACGTHDVVQRRGRYDEAEIRPRQQRQESKEGERLKPQAGPHRTRSKRVLQQCRDTGPGGDRRPRRLLHGMRGEELAGGAGDNYDGEEQCGSHDYSVVRGGVRPTRATPAQMNPMPAQRVAVIASPSTT